MVRAENKSRKMSRRDVLSEGNPLQIQMNPTAQQLGKQVPFEAEKHFYSHVKKKFPMRFLPPHQNFTRYLSPAETYRRLR